jgi:hypothetical protein
VYVNPGEEDGRVLTKTKISFTFSSPVRPTTTPFTLFCVEHRQYVAGEFSLDRDGVTYTFHPRERLHPFERYVCSVLSVADAEGKPTLPMSWVITTGPNEREVRHGQDYLGSWIVYETSPPGLKKFK